MTRGTAIAVVLVALGLGLALGVIKGRTATPGPAASSTSGSSALAAGTPALQVGEEVFAVAPDAVRGIDYETRRTRLAAVRVRDKAAFALTERDADGKVTARCQSGKAWDGLLDALSSLRVRRTFSPTEGDSLWARLAGNAATLRVHDSFVAEPSEFQVAVTNEDVVVRDASGVFVSSLPAHVLSVLSAGCR